MRTDRTGKAGSSVIAFPQPRPNAPAAPGPAPDLAPDPGPDLAPDLAQTIATLRAAIAGPHNRLRRHPDLPHATAAAAMAGRAGAARTRAAGPAAPGAVARTASNPDHTDGHTPPRDPLARRILALHLPRFPIERWLRTAAQRGDHIPDDLPFALATEGPHGPVIHATTRAAEQAGVHAGARVVDMRALCPGLRVDHADPGADRAALARLMLWSRRWCPWTAVDGAAGLMLDTTGSDHLHGGEDALLREVEGRLGTLGLTARLAIAPTQGAAWALARFGPHRSICTAADLALRMAPLPVRALRLSPDTVLLLQRLGLATVGDLAAVPRLSLARRFARAALAENPLLRLDQMMGRLAEPLASPDDPPRFAVQASLAEPVLDPTPFLPALAARLCADLAAAGHGARRISLTLYRSDGEVTGCTVATSQPSRDPAHLTRLFDGRLDRIDPGFGFDLIALSAPVAEALPTGQIALDGRSPDGADLAHLVDRFAARFGDHALRRPAFAQSHLPERREGWAPAMATPAPAPPATRPLPPRGTRPVRLFDPPEEVQVIYAVPEGPPAQFVWRRVTHRVTRFAGPERIAPEWWRDRPGTRLRDYYRIEDHHGLRFWIYREGVLDDGRGTTPRWFVQGAFE